MKKKGIGLSRIIGIIFLVAALVFAGGYFVLGRPHPEKAISFRPAEEQQGKYVYVDLVSLHSAFAGSNSREYYIGMDAEGYGYVLAMTDDQFRNIIRQYNANRLDDDYTYVLRLGTHRLTGIAKEADEKLIAAYCQVYQTETNSFREYFGKLYIDGTDSPDGRIRTICLWSGIGSVLMAVSGLIVLQGKKRGRKHELP